MDTRTSSYKPHAFIFSENIFSQISSKNILALRGINKTFSQLATQYFFNQPNQYAIQKKLLEKAIDANGHIKIETALLLKCIRNPNISNEERIKGLLLIAVQHKVDLTFEEKKLLSQMISRNVESPIHQTPHSFLNSLPFKGKMNEIYRAAFTNPFVQTILNFAIVKKPSMMLDLVEGCWYKRNNALKHLTATQEEINFILSRLNSDEPDYIIDTLLEALGIIFQSLNEEQLLSASKAALSKFTNGFSYEEEKFRILILKFAPLLSSGSIPHSQVQAIYHYALQRLMAKEYYYHPSALKALEIITPMLNQKQITVVFFMALKKLESVNTYPQKGAENLLGSLIVSERIRAEDILKICNHSPLQKLARLYLKVKESFINKNVLGDLAKTQSEYTQGIKRANSLFSIRTSAAMIPSEISPVRRRSSI